MMAAVAGAQMADTFTAFDTSTAANVKPMVVVPIPEMDIAHEHRLAAEEFGLTKVLKFGKINNISRDFFDFAHVEKLEEGLLYSAAFRVENAVSLAIHFDQFEVSEGGAVFVVGDNHVLGPWTHKQRWAEGNLMTRHVDGNQVTVQYYHSAGTMRMPALHIDVVTSAFQQPKMSAVCNIQAVCAEPENRCSGCDVRDRSCSIQCTHGDGDNSNPQWADQSWGDREQHATVAMATAAGSRFCSGSFINNADGKPLVLTAAHCGVSGTAVVHYFWRNPDCTSADNRAGDHEVAGNLVVLANAPESDMTLLEVRADNMPVGEIFLAGWEAGDISNPAQNVVGLHHPRASNQKISHGGAVITSRWSGSGDPTHWRINVWTEATTEPGSSGSPLYNRETRRIIGQLHGGSAACPAYNGYDAYGGVFRSFAQNAAFRTALTNDNGDTGMDGAFL